MKTYVEEFYLQHGTFEDRINKHSEETGHEIISVQVYDQLNRANVMHNGAYGVYDQVAIVVFKNEQDNQ